jgi:hypothetical protein
MSNTTSGIPSKPSAETRACSRPLLSCDGHTFDCPGELKKVQQAETPWRHNFPPLSRLVGS